MLQAIFWGGALCAILDGFAATLHFGARGIKPVRLWQGVASGLMGSAAFDRGWVTAALGLLLHSLIAMTASAVFTLMSHYLPVLETNYFVSGPLYGVIVFLVMNMIVVPLSKRPKTQRSWQDVAIQVVIHMFFVGLPIAAVASRFGV
jgi:hypothetical protein